MNDCWLPPVDRIVAAFAGLPHPVAPVVLQEAARGPNRALATLLSWWELQGDTLPEPLAAELGCHRDRLALYGDVLERARRVEPGLIPAKGPTVGNLYPPGLLRQTADLDLLCPSTDGLWAVARLLLSEGWSAEGIWVWCLAGEVHFHTVLKRPSGQPMLLADEKVELTTIAYPGDHLRREPRLRRWPEGRQPTLADCLVWLLDELGERQLRMRDLFDIAVLARAAEDEGLDHLVPEVAELISIYGVRSQLRGLVRDTGRYYPPAVPPLEQIERRVAVAPHRRLPWPLRRHPLATGLSMAVAVAKNGAPAVARERADDLLVAAQRRMPLGRLFERGVPLYGMALPGAAPVEGVTACSDGGAIWLDTPVGRFVGALGPAILQEWVDRATSGPPAGRQVQLV